MTYDRQFVSVDFLFRIGVSDEVAVTGLNYSVAAGFNNAVDAVEELTASPTNVDRIALAMIALLQPSTGLVWASYSFFEGVKIAAVGTDGKYLETSANPLERPASDNTHGSDGATLPQSTVVISLRSGQTFGAANYGRMYLPHTRMQLDAGRPNADTVGTNLAAAAAKVFVNKVTLEMQGGTTHELQPMIMTNKTGATSKKVAQVKVGNVIDTQRRRRNRLAELYSTETL